MAVPAHEATGFVRGRMIRWDTVLCGQSAEQKVDGVWDVLFVKGQAQIWQIWRQRTQLCDRVDLGLRFASKMCWAPSVRVGGKMLGGLSPSKTDDVMREIMDALKATRSETSE